MHHSLKTAKNPLTCKIEECGNSERWLEVRQKAIGASVAAQALDLLPPQWNKGPLELWAELTGKAPREQPTGDGIEWGNRLEPVVAEAYADKTGHILHNLGKYTICRSPAWPFMIATLDRIIETPEHELEDLECKTADARHEDQWAGNETEGESPMHYQVQVQHQLSVTGLSRGVLACLIGGRKFVMRHIERNEEFIGWMQTELAKFWRCVETGTPPPIKKVPSRELMERMFPRAQPGSIVDLGPSFDAIGDDIVTLKALLKRGKERLDELESHFTAALRDNESGVTPSGGVWTWKNVERAGYTVKPSSYRQLRYTPPKSKKENILSAETAAKVLMIAEPKEAA